MQTLKGVLLAAAVRIARLLRLRSSPKLHEGICLRPQILRIAAAPTEEGAAAAAPALLCDLSYSCAVQPVICDALAQLYSPNLS